MYDQLFVDQKLQTQKKKVNTEQQQTKRIKMVTTPLQAILKDDNESVLNTLRKGQRIAFDVLLDISIIIELIVKDYSQRPVEERREYEFLSYHHLSFVYSHFFGKRPRTSSSEKSIWLGKVEPLDIVVTECPPQMRSLIGPLLKTFATNIATMYSDERVPRLLEKTLLRQEKYIIKKLEDQIRGSCQTKSSTVDESSTQMDVHLPTEERNTTSDVTSPMLAEEASASLPSSDTSKNKQKKIARYIKSLLMRQDSIHEAIDSQSIERNLQHLELSNLEVSVVLNIHNFFRQLALLRVREVDVDKHVLVSLPVVKA
ncbi:hypothetical protein BCV72DRAFT_303475 [Rhizopus microsporus var. microsporus]|uniref:Uncharacterized protein n=2 Tax=Rhizopus microsporus TaxID=58291 RepID=A0A2G4T936_RHIZD|nr:uncharacterized protein RHIMIDRAFT_232954 [Rhizopus microsporus ATCC 52813]ORE08660.1 hypothetical protein BCV72DRAFT_303475 [Rhizopus microsporus var. microsporus]PHZ17527.1 hypothetical protein RHIMIDRAFT_232954 [Rhizopus microsporus ATCC 52813]